MKRVSTPRSLPAARLVAWAVIASAGSITLSGCGSSSACDLDVVLRSRVGAGAVDCGHVAVGAPATVTDQCVADQTAAGTPFFARYDAQGTDSRIAFGVVRDPGGRTWVLLWDSDPSGGSGAPGVITENVCSGDPTVGASGAGVSGPPVHCTAATSTDLVCSG